jgi:hypothetical protein
MATSNSNGGATGASNNTGRDASNAICANDASDATGTMDASNATYASGATYATGAISTGSNNKPFRLRLPALVWRWRAWLTPLG